MALQNVFPRADTRDKNNNKKFNFVFKCIVNFISVLEKDSLFLSLSLFLPVSLFACFYHCTVPPNARGLCIDPGETPKVPLVCVSPSVTLDRAVYTRTMVVSHSEVRPQFAYIFVC